MSLSEDLVAMMNGQPKKCRVQQVIDEVDESDRNLLREALEGKASIEPILNVLRQHDIHLGWHTVTRHRGGTCICNKGAS